MVLFHVELCVYTLGCRFHYIEVKLKMFVLSIHLHCHQKCCVASGLGPEDAYQVLRPCVRSLLRYSLTGVFKILLKFCLIQQITFVRLMLSDVCQI